MRMAYVEAIYQPVSITTYGDTDYCGPFYGSARVKLARGPIARQWSFKITNIGGEDVNLTSFEILFDRTGRKV